MSVAENVTDGENGKSESAQDSDSYKSALLAAWDEQEKQDSSDAPVGEKSHPLQGAQDEGDITSEAAPTDASEEPQITPLAAPEHWSAERKETFGKLAELGDEGVAAQQLLLDREREFEKGIGEKSQDAASARKQVERFEEMIAPYRDMWRMRGMDEYQGVGTLLAYQRALDSQPVETLRFLAQQYGVDLTTLVPSDEDVDPQVAALRKENAELKAQRSADQSGQRQAQQAQMNAAIGAFKDEKGSDGKLLHPHFDAVLSDMTDLAFGMRQRGQTPELKTLYDRAVLMHPELTKPTPPPPPKPGNPEKAAIVQRARSAATTNVRSSTPAKAPVTTKPKTTKELLREAYEEQEQRSR